MAAPFDSAFAFSSLLQSAEWSLFSAARSPLENLHPEDAAAHLDQARRSLALIDEHLEAVREKLQPVKEHKNAA